MGELEKLECGETKKCCDLHQRRLGYNQGRACSALSTSQFHFVYTILCTFCARYYHCSIEPFTTDSVSALSLYCEVNDGYLGHFSCEDISLMQSDKPIDYDHISVHF